MPLEQCQQVVRVGGPAHRPTSETSAKGDGLHGAVRPGSLTRQASRRRFASRRLGDQRHGDAAGPTDSTGVEVATVRASAMVWCMASIQEPC